MSTGKNCLYGLLLCCLAAFLSPTAAGRTVALPFPCDAVCDGDTIRLDTTICANQLPFHWYGVTFTRDSSVLMATPAMGYLYLTVRVTPNPIHAVSPPHGVCAGDTVNLAIAYQSPLPGVTLYSPHAAISESQKIFLPDGMSCQPYGTYYRSYAHFTDFPAHSMITSADDILYLRIKIEHSALEDLHIALVCPNGSSCQITPSLTQQIFNSYWDGTVLNEYFRVNLGLANRHIDHLSCDSSLNPIGVPWNYIWSNNTNHGYQYAGGQHSFIYESANVHQRYNPLWDNSGGNQGFYPHVVDSSNVALMQNIYHPKQSFANLVGCPLNGDWYIQVQDLQSEDNGYLVEWELSLDPRLLPSDAPPVISRNIAGTGVSRRDDSTFVVHTPSSFSRDTMLLYTATVVDSAGCTYHTSFPLSVYGVTTTVLHDTISRNRLPHTFQGFTFPVGAPDDVTHEYHYTSSHGCDSTVEYFLHIVPLDTFYEQRAICSTLLPYEWHSVRFSHADTLAITANSSPGIDKVIILQLSVGDPFYDTLIVDILDYNLPYILNGQPLYNDTSYTLAYITEYGCDSIYYFALRVHYPSSHVIDTAVCDYQLPFLWNGHTFNADAIVTDTLTDPFGADSILTLRLTIVPTHIEIISHTEDFCDEVRAELEVITDFEDYIWSTGQTIPVITVTAPGRYSVVGKEGHCTRRATHIIEVCDYQLMLPNAITPSNADGLNDWFGIPPAIQPQMADLGFRITIADRWGNVVFHSTDKAFRWDGKVDGVLHPNTAYTYVIQYQTLLGEKMTLKGGILVL